MSQEIRVGDLVEVAYPTPCCGNSEACGIFFVVSRIHQQVVPRCRHCLQPSKESGALGASDRMRFRLSRLRRIPPLEQLDGCSEDVHKIVKEPANEVTA